MEMKSFENYDIADITTDDLKKIHSLENTIRNKTNKNIVLIAYEEKDNVKG